MAKIKVKNVKGQRKLTKKQSKKTRGGAWLSSPAGQARSFFVNQAGVTL